MKPGITLSNTIAAGAGFFLAASFAGFTFTTLVGVIGGVACIIASACVINNIIDRDRDVKMKRTKKREIPLGNISLVAASIYAAALGAVGFLLLALWTNTLTVILGVIAYIWYIVIYGVAKRTTPQSTLIGAVCGALPPVAGYTAVANQLDATAWVLFILLMTWQMAHFYGIAVFRRDDYARAELPVWSVRYSTKSTKVQIMLWVILFALTVPFLTILEATGYVYLVIMAGLSAYWVYVGVANYGRLTDEKWSKKMFGISLIVLLALCGMIATGGYLV